MKAGAPELAARFRAAHARLRTVAVTGTNGKTTTVSLLARIVEASGAPAARLTTVGAWVDGAKVEAPTASAEFLATVEAAVRRGVPILALETTSKALAGGLARRWPAEVGVFTNLSRDHFDLHGSPEAYLAAKAQLFMALPPGGVAVLNAADANAALIAEVVPEHAETRFFGPGGALEAARVEVAREGTRIALAPGPLAERLGGALQLRLHGAVHAENALAAAVAADALGLAPEAIVRGLAAFAGVPGRFEVVGRAPLVAVDYAHTPAALEATLETARALRGEGGRLWLVFGCGGVRDRGKRAAMGAVAERGADEVVLTSDNPRAEDPAAIADAVEAGRGGGGARWRRELDRRAAIRAAIAGAREADVVVIAGKGHETTQELATGSRHFSDVEEARKALHSC
ncbi:MAG TPA: UDP-N-acetylmuramyl-tripeptide synthetase [Polyangiaceae bacterium LLY-WYZ-15_(1-7)]|nr:hypothetical protein [Myxococcales bacterium]MAT25280.1 hypothetical protein [Sandaracinus sp.]HJL05101.1 UDP-N-acetylmuramyl-tripeptide synthetase [Polyangiaceae bacterium LLY-WYZ-15_(1-7)]MBJ70634.1 hypothetical protein [Sandaracinus sp.]HJL11633.1 UDP-N-acetylmuramyl-tripeptide synthetase [Polyangiaceae bacterium LLY-WYZ-15_(1-7)]